MYFCAMEIEKQANNPLHGITLKKILEDLLAHYGWLELAKIVRINCFVSNPSINSSLTFLRRTPWARKKVEDLYIHTFLIRNKNK